MFVYEFGLTRLNSILSRFPRTYAGYLGPLVRAKDAKKHAPRARFRNLSHVRSASLGPDRIPIINRSESPLFLSGSLRRTFVLVASPVATPNRIGVESLTAPRPLTEEGKVYRQLPYLQYHRCTCDLGEYMDCDCACSTDAKLEITGLGVDSTVLASDRDLLSRPEDCITDPNSAALCHLGPDLTGLRTVEGQAYNGQDRLHDSRGALEP